MANELHLQILEKGVSTWNAWRQEQGWNGWRARFYTQSLSSSEASSLQTVDLSHSNLTNANLYAADFYSEVRAALERETKEKRQVLFPIRIDDAVMDSTKARAADIRRQRNIGDFSNWKNHDKYLKAFERLLRDLKAG